VIKNQARTRHSTGRSELVRGLLLDIGLNRRHCRQLLIEEIVHNIDDSIRLIDEILEEGLDEEKAMLDIKPRAGRGVGVVEAPRGLLIHDYTYNEMGRVEKANLIIPTGMNYANMEKDMHVLVTAIINKNEDEIKLACEMMIRAYDPCISCSTHFLNVKLVNK